MSRPDWFGPMQGLLAAIDMSDASTEVKSAAYDGILMITNAVFRDFKPVYLDNDNIHPPKICIGKRGSYKMTGAEYEEKSKAAFSAFESKSKPPVPELDISSTVLDYSSDEDTERPSKCRKSKKSKKHKKRKPVSDSESSSSENELSDPEEEQKQHSKKHKKRAADPDSESDSDSEYEPQKPQKKSKSKKQQKKSISGLDSIRAFFNREIEHTENDSDTMSVHELWKAYSDSSCFDSSVKQRSFQIHLSNMYGAQKGRNKLGMFYKQMKLREF
jgi:hypothetical protein